VKEDEMGRACSTNAGEEECIGMYRILIRKPEGKRPVGRPSSKWVDNTEMDVSERGWGGMDWMDLAQDRDHWRALVNMVMNLRVPENAGKFLNSCTTGGF
jgi:hypothetical protein